MYLVVATSTRFPSFGYMVPCGRQPTKRSALRPKVYFALGIVFMAMHVGPEYALLRRADLALGLLPVSLRCCLGWVGTWVFMPMRMREGKVCAGILRNIFPSRAIVHGSVATILMWRCALLIGEGGRMPKSEG